jgi:hypothetical protein
MTITIVTGAATGSHRRLLGRQPVLPHISSEPMLATAMSFGDETCLYM